MSETMKQTKRTTLNLSLDNAKTDKESLNIKISKTLNENLKLARAIARNENKKFNVSTQVEEYLETLLEMFETGLKVSLEDYKLVDGKAVKK